MKLAQKITPKGFEPIELKLTIESQDELLELWHRLNLSFDTIKKAYRIEDIDPGARFPQSENLLSGLWRTLNQRVGVSAGNPVFNGLAEGLSMDIAKLKKAKEMMDSECPVGMM